MPTKISVKIYDINDLTFTIRDFKGPKITLDPNRVGTLCVGCFPVDDDEDKGLDRDALLELITSNISPSSWEDDDRTAASIVRGHLVVTQDAATHVEIAKLLEMLRLER